MATAGGTAQQTTSPLILLRIEGSGMVLVVSFEAAAYRSQSRSISRMRGVAGAELSPKLVDLRLETLSLVAAAAPAPEGLTAADGIVNSGSVEHPCRQIHQSRPPLANQGRIVGVQSRQVIVADNRVNHGQPSTPEAEDPGQPAQSSGSRHGCLYGVVLFGSLGGEPHNDHIEHQANPLGPLQAGAGPWLAAWW